jgi:putative tricarboxylic transport membrane protein
VYLALAMGLGGFVLRLLKMPLAALVLGMILGGPLETYFLQAHVLYGSLWAAFTRPVCLTLLLLTAAAVGYSLLKEFRARRVELLVHAPR